MNKIPLMAHLVAGYPSDELAKTAARGLAAGGASYFEIQFPFSDPSADGKAIQTACAETLANGFRLEDGFAFVSHLRKTYPDIPVCIMTYANLAYKTGIDAFAERAARAGAFGLIIPDLPFDTDEGLHAACLKRGLVSIPVAAPSMTAERIASLAALRRPYVYAALRAGITGSDTVIDEATLAFLASLSGSGSRILGGFGIRRGDQAAALSPAVHAVVAGSVFVDLIREHAGSASANPADAVFREIEAKTRELCFPG